jgi:hypothetical protein
VNKFLAFPNKNQGLGPDLRVEKFLNQVWRNSKSRRRITQVMWEK